MNKKLFIFYLLILENIIINNYIYNNNEIEIGNIDQDLIINGNNTFISSNNIHFNLLEKNSILDINTNNILLSGSNFKGKNPYGNNYLSVDSNGNIILQSAIFNIPNPLNISLINTFTINSLYNTGLYINTIKGETFLGNIENKTNIKGKNILLGFNNVFDKNETEIYINGKNLKSGLLGLDKDNKLINIKNNYNYQDKNEIELIKNELKSILNRIEKLEYFIKNL